MAAGGIVYNSDFTNWNNRLTNIRSKRGLGAYNVNNPGAGTVATAAKMNELVNKAINSWNNSAALRTRTTYSHYGVATVSAGALIKWMNFPDMLTNWEGCYCSTQSTQGTNGTNGHDSSDNCTGTNSTCSTNVNCNTYGGGK